ncbi:MAG: hypothetical protein ACREMA_10965 [Longimicrobiales bacterium]
MVMNRLASYVKQSRGPPPGPEFYIVRSSGWTLLVSRETARAVLKQLNRWLVPRWIRVVDVSGSEIWLPSQSIEVLVESTPEQRAQDRTLRRKLDEENNDGAPVWD